MKQEEKRVFGFSRNVFFLGVVSFLADVSSEMIYPLLPVFLFSVLRVSRTFIGLIEGIAESTASLLKVLSGWLSDKIMKRKALVFCGYSLSAISKPFLALAQAGWHVLLVRFVDRVGKGIRTSPRDALVADSCEETERGKCFGFHRTMDHLGAITGPLVATALLPLVHQNYRAIFLISFIPGLLAVLFVSLFVTEKIGKLPAANLSSPSAEAPKLAWRGLSREFKLFIIIITLFTLGNSSDAFLLLRAQNLKVPVILIPTLWAMFNFSQALFAMPGGILSDKIGRRNSLFFGFLVYSFVYFGFAFASHSTQIWTLFFIYGLYYGLTDGVSRAYVADLVPSEVRATAYGIYHTAVGISALPASLILGALWHALGAEVAFSFGASLSLLAALLLFILPKKS